MAEHHAKAEKASIKNLDQGGPAIECMFNPKEYSISKQNSWNAGKNTAANVPQLEFGSGQPATLQMQLFFDTYGASDPDVSKHTERVWSLMLVDPTIKIPGKQKNKKSRPPRVLFHWGSTFSFEAVITSIKQQFTLFNAQGVPVRATLDVTFQEYKDAKEKDKQNPTSGGEGGERLWHVTSGDTLDWIAFREYGDAALWPLIARANRLTFVRRLVPGTTLVIPNA